MTVTAFDTPEIGLLEDILLRICSLADAISGSDREPNTGNSLLTLSGMYSDSYLCETAGSESKQQMYSAKRIVTKIMNTTTALRRIDSICIFS